MILLKHYNKDKLLAGERLKSLGIVKSDGTINRSLVLEILLLLKRRVSQECSAEVRCKRVPRGLEANARDKLHRDSAAVDRWTDEFEHFPAERKKRRRVRGPETLKYCKSLFKKYLEGRELSEQLIDYVVNHPNEWLRNMFRHYIQIPIL